MWPRRSSWVEGRRKGLSGLRDTEEFGHLVVEKALAWFVRLDPLSIEHELRDSTLAGVFHNLRSGAGRRLDVDFCEGDGVLVEEALRFAAIAAPVG